MRLNPEKRPTGPPKSEENPEIVVDGRLKGAFSRLQRPWRVVQRARSSGSGSITRPQWMMILKMSGAIRSSLIQSKSGRRPDRCLAAPAGSSRSILIMRGPYEAAVVLGEGSWRRSRWPFPGGRNTRGSSWGSGFGRKAAVAAWTSAAAKFVSRPSDFLGLRFFGHPSFRVSGIRVSEQGSDVGSGSKIEEVLGGERALKAERAQKR
jgi:hypothetical protein